MSQSNPGTRSMLAKARAEAAQNQFLPLTTIRSIGRALFITQAARDLACLLDVDDDVIAWTCLPREFETVEGPWIPDFLVEYADGRRLYLDTAILDQHAWVSEAIATHGEIHRIIPKSEIYTGHRLQNAKDLFRYGKTRTPLNDRVRIVAALQEAGSLTVAECFHLFREVQPMTGLAWLALHRFIAIDLDEGPIGPETLVRTFQR